MDERERRLKEQMQEKTEQIASEPAQIQIYDKKTGRNIDYAEAPPHEAKANAERMISGKSGVGYRIIKPM